MRIQIPCFTPALGRGLAVDTTKLPHLGVVFALFALLLNPATASAAVLRVPEDHTTIQAAIDAAGNTDEIWIGEGTYLETLDLRGKSLTLLGIAGADVTIIDGTDLGAPLLWIEPNPALGTIPTPTIRHLTFTKGDGQQIGNSRRGGAMVIEDSRPSIELCRFIGNRANAGGAIHCTSSTLTVTGCEFAGHNGTSGGAVGSSDCTIDFFGCIFRNNFVNSSGGALSLSSGTYRITDCTFTSNTARGLTSGTGGAIRAGGVGLLHIDRCVFSNNSCRHSGSSINASDIDTRITNSLFTDDGGNHSIAASPLLMNNCTLTFIDDRRRHSALLAVDGNIIDNCIFWMVGNGSLITGSGTPTLRHCLVKGGYPGTDILNTDPMFRDEANGDYRLAPGSPCIDRGNSNLVPIDAAQELDGNPRIVDAIHYGDTGIANNDGAVVDLGAYEVNSIFMQPIPICEGDADGNGTVDVSDISMVLFRLGPGGPAGDVNGDGVVDVNDLSFIIFRLGSCDAG